MLLSLELVRAALTGQCPGGVTGKNICLRIIHGGEGQFYNSTLDQIGIALGF